MSKISALSLDFWNTIGIPNNEFGIRRNEYLSQKSGKSYEEVERIYKEIKSNLDRRAADFGEDVPNEECWNILGKKLNIDNDEHFKFLVFHIQQNLFYQLSPIILRETIIELYRINSKGVKINIASNTNFIKGRYIKNLIARNEIPIDFFVFSDEVGAAKPNKVFFDKVKSLYSCPPNEILHCGDCEEFDIVGAEAAEFQSKLIKNAFELPKFLKTI